MTQMLGAMLNRADSRRHNLFVRLAFRRLLKKYRKPTLLLPSDIERLKREQRETREKRSYEPESERAPLISIGIFAYNRPKLLARTCESLARFLKEHGATFPHEVILIHDGPTESLRAWAETQPLFSRIVFNTENRGLSNNLNLFWSELSCGAYLLPLEDDWICEFSDNFILRAKDILETDPSVGNVRLERKYPGDYSAWDEAYKIHTRKISEEVFQTPSGHAYRLIAADSDTFYEGVYGNSCSLFRFSSLACVGPMPMERKRRIEERIYMEQYSRYWLAARGLHPPDSPFLHIGYGQSCSTWDD